MLRAPRMPKASNTTVAAFPRATGLPGGGRGRGQHGRPGGRDDRAGRARRDRDPTTDAAALGKLVARDTAEAAGVDGAAGSLRAAAPGREGSATVSGRTPRG